MSKWINVVVENANAQFKESTKLTKPHVDSIINQEQVMRKMDSSGRSSEELMRESKATIAHNRYKTDGQNWCTHHRRTILQRQKTKGAALV